MELNGWASPGDGPGNRVVGVGGSLGLILFVVGAVVHSTAAEVADVVILVTLLVVGIALIAVQVYGELREREHLLARGRHPHSP